MATSETLNSMLKRHMPYQLLVETVKKKNYFWNKIEKDEEWMGGTLDVPFEGAEASSLSFGGLTAADDISEHAEVLGYLSAMPELWGTMIFHEKDLDRHGSLEKSFLKILPNKLEQFSDRMAERVSLALLNGAIAKATGNGGAAGTLAVDHPERFTIGEKVELIDSGTAAANYYVTAISMPTKTLTLSATRGGEGADIQAYATAQGARLNVVGGNAAGFTSLGSSLLSAANGGAAAIYNQTKTAYPFLQAQQFSGSGFTSATIMNDIYDVFFDTMSLGKGKPTDVICSLGDHFKWICKKLEDSRAFVTADKSAGYGWRSVKVLGPDGEMNIVGVRDMAADKMFVVDWDAMKFHGNNFFERKRHVNGDEFYMTRATTGYDYIVDIKFFGDLIVNKPSHCGVVYGIPALTA
jgi:hypothetical protein